MRSTFLLAVIVLISTASPAEAQQTTMQQHQWMPSSLEEKAAPGVWKLTLSTAGILPTEDFAQEALISHAGPRWSRRQATLAGIGIGTLTGIAAFAIQSNGCWRQGESMCGLAIPIYVGVGAAAGGLIGYVLGSRSP